MDQVEERDQRMSLKEMEKRQLFDRIIALETRLSLLEGDAEESQSAGGDGFEEDGDGV